MNDGRETVKYRVCRARRVAFDVTRLHNGTLAPTVASSPATVAEIMQPLGRRGPEGLWRERPRRGGQHP